MTAFKPLHVVARLEGPVCLPGGPLGLDSLLAAAVAARDALPPPLNTGDVPTIEIPVMREAQGRFHLASFGVCEVEERENRWLNKRTDVSEAQALGDDKFKRVQLSTGVNKSWRLPMELMHLKGDRMEWWCQGDRGAIAALLEGHVGYLGKKRGNGHGRVAAWIVEPCTSWGDGFPVAVGGYPLRPLPPDWPGLAEDVERAYRTLTYPYWRRDKEQLCAVPPWA